MTQTPTTDPSSHGLDKHNWDENALGNSEAVVKKTERQNNPPSNMRYKKIRHKKNRLTQRVAINFNKVISGALGGSRTPDPQVRSLMLYPTELQALN